MERTINIELVMNESDVALQFKETSTNFFQDINAGIDLEVQLDGESGGKKAAFRCLPEEYMPYKAEILGFFETKYEEQLRVQKDNFESGLENAEEEEEPGIKVPYDPRLITVAPAKFSLKEIVSMIEGDPEEEEEPVLDLAPDFQRDYVWDNVRKSRLIESILLHIPLPIFYFARDKYGKMQVVDGVQRLTTIYKFFKNEFKLSRLEYLKEECDGRYFKKKGLPEDKNLRPKLVRELRSYQIDCNIIEPSTPENVKLDIFKRLNTGGRELNKQEVRHSFMKKDVRDFVKKLVNTEEFQKATDHSVSDKRMLAQELIMRYIGFYCLYINNFLNIEYSTKMDEFLDNLAVKLNCCRKIPYDDISEKFLRAMNNAYLMFGRLAFRKMDRDKAGNVLDKKNPINKSLFIAFSVLLSSYSPKVIEKRGIVVSEFADFLYGDAEFYDAISHNTNYQLRETAIEKVRIFLDRIYE